jgi:hypothetical protein
MFLSFRPWDLCDGAAREQDCRVDEMPEQDSCPPCGVVVIDARELEASAVSAT